MNWRGRGGSYVLVAVAGMMFSLAQIRAVAQTVTTYTSAQAWQAAVKGSPEFSEDFHIFTKDTYFQTAPTNVGPFSLQQVGLDTTFGLFRNFVDLPPLQFADNSGITYAALYTKSGLITVNMNFSVPVYAWGANFYSSQSAELENLVLTEVGGGTIATVPVTVDTGFFGFVLSPSTGISQITFESQIQNPDPSVGQGFGLEGVVGATSVPATLLFSPSSAKFGSVAIGSTSRTIPITVTNYTGTRVGYESMLGTNEFHFNGESCGPVSPGTTLPAGGSCTFNVNFSPTAVGAANGSLTLSTSAGPMSFHVSGTGTPGPLVFSPLAANFGNITVGKTSATIAVKVTNNTGSTVSYKSSAGLDEFHFQGETCGAVSPGTTLGPGASCTFGVDFVPTATGSASGSVTISTSTGPVTFHLSGTGVPAT